MKRRIDKSEVVRESKEVRTEERSNPSDSSNKKALPTEFKGAVKFVPQQVRKKNT